MGRCLSIPVSGSIKISLPVDRADKKGATVRGGGYSGGSISGAIVRPGDLPAVPSRPAAEGGKDLGLLESCWYTTEELAQMLCIDPSTVRRWRTARPVQGPAFVQLSSRVTVYSARDVEQWLLSRRTDPSETRAN